MRSTWSLLQLFRQRWQIGVSALVALGLVVALFHAARAPAVVQPQPVSSQQATDEVMGTGTLEAHIKAKISSKIAGRIGQVLADQGDTIRVGQVLVRLDDEDFKQQVELEQAKVLARQAAVNRLEAEGIRARATRALAVRDHQRARQLVMPGALAVSELDKYVEALAVATAEVTRSEAALVEGRKQLIAAEKSLEFHRARLADTVLVAPFAGVIIRRDRHPGDILVPGTPVLCLVATDELWVSAWVDETEMARLSPGQPARVVFRSEPEWSYPAKVIRLGREADRETREFLVDVQPEALPKNWAIGQRAEVYIRGQGSGVRNQEPSLK